MKDFKVLWWWQHLSDQDNMKTVYNLYYYSIWLLAVTTTAVIDGYAIQTTRQKSILTIETSRLYSSPQQQRQPRRDLQKRPRKNRISQDSQQLHFDERTGAKYGRSSHNRFPLQQLEDFPWETAESRSFIAAAAREAGEDYWIDLDELRREQERLERKKLRDPGQMPDQKLWTEVLSPYKQNWIGMISVSIVAFAFIFKYFPEVINPPVIANIPEML
jgi:hypothetical protein